MNDLPLDDLERLVEPEWLDWYRLSPQERWAESERLWVSYLAMGRRNAKSG